MLARFPQKSDLLFTICFFHSVIGFTQEYSFQKSLGKNPCLRLYFYQSDLRQLWRQVSMTGSEVMCKRGMRQVERINELLLTKEPGLKEIIQHIHFLCFLSL